MTHRPDQMLPKPVMLIKRSIEPCPLTRPARPHDNFVEIHTRHARTSASTHASAQV